MTHSHRVCALLVALLSFWGAAEANRCAIPANRTQDWGSIQYSSCSFDVGWEELAMQEYVCSNPLFTGCQIHFKTGDLGDLKEE
eukprot:1858809-Rhodomonas_salina.1